MSQIPPLPVSHRRRTCRMKVALPLYPIRAVMRKIISAAAVPDAISQLRPPPELDSAMADLKARNAELEKQLRLARQEKSSAEERQVSNNELLEAIAHLRPPGRWAGARASWDKVLEKVRGRLGRLPLSGLPIRSRSGRR